MKSKMVLTKDPGQNRLTIYVDPGRIDAWRREPYYSQIKFWATAVAKDRGQVIAIWGVGLIAVTPDREINLGPVREDQSIMTSVQMGPNGREIDVFVVEKDDPRLQKQKEFD